MSRLGAFLEQEGILTHADRQIIRRESQGQHGSFARSVLVLGLLDEYELSSLLAAKTIFPQANKDILQEVDPGAVSLVPSHILAWLEVLPLSAQEGTLRLAMVDPTDEDAINQIQFFSGLRVKPVIAIYSEIIRGLREVGVTIDLGTSQFEEFIRTHGKYNNVQAKGGASRKSGHESSQGYGDSDEDDDHETSNSDWEQNGSDAVSTLFDFNTGQDTSSETVSSWSDEIALSDPPAGLDMSDPGLAAAAPDEPVDEASIGLTVDLPPELQDESERQEAAAMLPPIAIDAELPDMAGESILGNLPDIAPGHNALGDLDLSGLDDELSFDLDDDGNEIERPKKAATSQENVTAATTSSTIDSTIDSATASSLSLDDAFALESSLASADEDSSPDLDSLDDEDIDLSLDLGAGPAAALNLPGGLEDNVPITTSPFESDEPKDVLADMDDDAGEGLSLEGASDELSLDADDLTASLDLTTDELSLGDLDAPAIDSEAFVNSTVHPGIATLNRAMISMQMMADGAKALQRLADVASKVGIAAGAVVTAKSDQNAMTLRPGILWTPSKSSGDPSLPGGLTVEMISELGDGQGTPFEASWQPLPSLPNFAAMASAWPDQVHPPTHVMLHKTNGEKATALVIAFASFDGASQHEGLQQSFADLVRTVGGKL